MGINLPPCSYRVVTAVEDRYVCRHSAIHTPQGIVPGAACRSCPVRETVCEHPRPVPSQEELQQRLSPPLTSPSLLSRAWSLALAVRDFVADGLTTVNAADYARRLEICESCDQRSGSSCRQCGCQLALKAKGRAFHCPLGKWPEVDAAPESRNPSVSEAPASTP